MLTNAELKQADFAVLRGLLLYPPACRPQFLHEVKALLEVQGLPAVQASLGIVAQKPKVESAAPVSSHPRTTPPPPSAASVESSGGALLEPQLNVGLQLDLLGRARGVKQIKLGLGV